MLGVGISRICSPGPRQIEEAQDASADQPSLKSERIPFTSDTFTDASIEVCANHDLLRVADYLIPTYEDRGILGDYYRQRPGTDRKCSLSLRTKSLSG